MRKFAWMQFGNMLTGPARPSGNFKDCVHIQSMVENSANAICRPDFAAVDKLNGNAALASVSSTKRMDNKEEHVRTVGQKFVPT